jgi:(E)-4-hydroxy-3-methylbut-2-enyl-diphosphate synthase
MKSSHPKIMIESYRLLVKRMEELNWNYPLHLGVTEAGLGEDGRIKSSIGIGTLLLDGIGDTIRVSLTEDPWEEIKPAREMIKQFDTQRSYHKNKHFSFQTNSKKEIKSPPYFHEKGSVLLKLTKEEIESQDFLSSIGLFYQNGKYEKAPSAADAVFSSEPISDAYLEILKRSGVEYVSQQKIQEINLDEQELNLENPSILNVDLILAKFSSKSLDKLMALYEKLNLLNVQIPIVASSDYGFFSEESVIQASMEFGSFLINGVINGLQIDFKGSLKQKREFAFNILQGCGLRAIKTEYIACPGCGRTLFNLQDVTKLIQEKTKHLPGVKIAVMGCIVNGPGEMADADFGYVGSKTNQVDLYIKQKCVERSIPSELACAKLIELIKKEGKWIDP